jgi:hypothetical protein
MISATVATCPRCSLIQDSFVGCPPEGPLVPRHGIAKFPIRFSPFSWNSISMPEPPPALAGKPQAEVERLYRAVTVAIWNQQIPMGRDRVQKALASAFR